MKNLWVFIIVVFFIVAGFVLARFKQPEMTADLDRSVVLATVEDCDLSQSRCATHGYQLEFERPVRPLSLFKARLISEKPLDSAVLYLEMKDMDMGINRFPLVPKGNGSWEAELMIPVCATGRRDWLATLVVQENGRGTRVIFPLSVEGK
jgi:hypothetical protein